MNSTWYGHKALDPNARECYGCGAIDLDYSWGIGFNVQCPRCGSYEIYYMKGL